MATRVRLRCAPTCGGWGKGAGLPAPPAARPAFAAHGLYEMGRAPPRMHLLRLPRPGRRASPALAAAPLAAVAAAAAAVALGAHLAAAPAADAAFAYEMSPSLPMDKIVPAGGCAESRFVVSERDTLAIPPGGTPIAFELLGEAAQFIELDPPSLTLTADMPRQFTTLRIDVPADAPEGSYGGAVTAAKQESATQVIKLKRSFMINVTAGPPPEGAGCVPPGERRGPEPAAPATTGAEECGPGAVLRDGECVDADPPEGGGCLVATAAYGTELAPQVQRLRELRDSPPLASGPGLALVSGINAAYYSFSPAVADLERQSPAFREAVRLLAAPAIAAAGMAAPVAGGWGGDAGKSALQYGGAASLLLLAAGAYVAARTPAAPAPFRAPDAAAATAAAAAAPTAAAASPPRRPPPGAASPPRR